MPTVRRTESAFYHFSVHSECNHVKRMNGDCVSCMMGIIRRWEIQSRSSFVEHALWNVGTFLARLPVRPCHLLCWQRISHQIRWVVSSNWPANDVLLGGVRANWFRVHRRCRCGTMHGIIRLSLWSLLNQTQWRQPGLANSVKVCRPTVCLTCSLDLSLYSYIDSVETERGVQPEQFQPRDQPAEIPLSLSIYSSR